MKGRFIATFLWFGLGLRSGGALAIYDAVQANCEIAVAGLVAVMTGFAAVTPYAGTALLRRRPRGW